MSIDFSKVDCQTTTNKKRFGIYDSEDNSPARIMFDKEDVWNAVVENDTSKTIIHTAVDNCIEIRRGNGEMEARCDSMLLIQDTLILLELKNKRDSWQSEGLLQIEAVIRRMKEENHSLYADSKKRKGVVANRKAQFPSFSMSNKEQREYFMREYKMRIEFESVIKVK